MEAKASKCIQPGLYWKNYLTAAYLYIRTENSSTGCTNILRGFCKMLWYCSILFILNQSRQLWIKQKKNNTFYCFKCILQCFKHSLLTDLWKLWFFSLHFTTDRLDNLRPPIKISFYLVPPIVFSFRTHTRIFHLVALRCLSLSRWRFLNNPPYEHICGTFENSEFTVMMRKC